MTAALVGLKSRAAVFQVQRYVNDYRREPLLAILPGALRARNPASVREFEARYERHFGPLG